MPVNILWQ